MNKYNTIYALHAVQPQPQQAHSNESSAEAIMPTFGPKRSISREQALQKQVKIGKKPTSIKKNLKPTLATINEGSTQPTVTEEQIQHQITMMQNSIREAKANDNVKGNAKHKKKSSFKVRKPPVQGEAKEDKDEGIFQDLKQRLSLGEKVNAQMLVLIDCVHSTPKAQPPKYDFGTPSPASDKARKILNHRERQAQALYSKYNLQQAIACQQFVMLTLVEQERRNESKIQAEVANSLRNIEETLKSSLVIIEKKKKLQEPICEEEEISKYMEELIPSIHLLSANNYKTNGYFELAQKKKATRYQIEQVKLPGI